jgi:hypothetical protein
MRQHDIHGTRIFAIHKQHKVSQKPLQNLKTMDFISRRLRLDSSHSRHHQLVLLLMVVSTDDFAGPLANQTNLALKAILGIRAMGEIASLTKNKVDAKDFRKTSEEYMEKWEKYTFDKNATHAKLAYQLNDSWGLSFRDAYTGSLYNAYADDLLDLRLFPDRVRDIQDSWYRKETGTSE